MTRLTHLDDAGAAHMVDVSGKASTSREAKAEATITLSGEAFAAVLGGTAPKGDVFAAARIAGIMAAKKVPDLIPLCHSLALSKAAIAFEPLPDESAIRIIATAATTGTTGVEMEALTAASVAALTLYDMIKAVDKAAVIGGIRLLAKSGGKSGEYVAPEVRQQKNNPEVRERINTPEARPSPPMRIAPTERHQRVKPRTLMGEVSGPRLGPDAQRDAFRKFMIAHRLQPTAWAREAGVPGGEILGFLTGRSRGLSTGVAEKLAAVAKVSVDDLFR